MVRRRAAGCTPRALRSRDEDRGAARRAFDAERFSCTSCIALNGAFPSFHRLHSSSFLVHREQGPSPWPAHSADAIGSRHPQGEYRNSAACISRVAFHTKRARRRKQVTTLDFLDVSVSIIKISESPDRACGRCDGFEMFRACGGNGH